ncbi:MAG: hypothetical protein KF716_22010 [Anaerolineae bacterium]|nr:hypothetical protein [Anaerolineae bacterium]
MRTRRQRLVTYTTRVFAIGLILFSLLITRGVQPLRAQGGACSDVVKAALQRALQVCSGQRNSACLGSPSAQASPKAGGSAFNFSQPGDTVPLSNLGSLSLSGYSSDSDSLGVALLNVPAALAGTNVGSGATVIVFGNTQITNGSQPGQLPMQAFYLRNSAGAPGCENVAADGILIQSPAGQKKVQLVANGVQLAVGSTVFLSAQANEEENGKAKLNVQTLQGEVSVTVDEQTIEVPSGAQTNVPLNEVNGEYEADGEPEAVQPLDKDEFDDLPLDELPESLDLSELEQEWETESDNIEQGDENTPEPEESIDSTPEPDESLEPTPEDETGTDDSGSHSQGDGSGGDSGGDSGDSGGEGSD